MPRQQPKTPFYLKLFLILLPALITHKGFAQDPFKFDLNEENGRHIRISGNAQFWLRHSQMNPGSLVNGKPREDLTDLSVRRFRLGFSGKASEKLSFKVLLGNNNVNYYTRKDFEVKLLEAYMDYQLSPQLAVGIGKQGWTGLSRYAAPASGATLAHDISFVPAPLVVVYDDILRRWGIYARGIIQNLDYRVSLSRPSISSGENRIPLPDRATFADKRPAYQFSTYLKYQFFEHEPQFSAWSAGTYLGKKRVFNIGAGFLYQPNTTWHIPEYEIIYNSFSSFALDLFYEQPLAANKAVTFYLSYHNHDAGKNFLRNIGVNNPASGGFPTAFINGPGNSTPIVGTGNILFTQAGYLFPADRENKRQLQPFASLSYGLLEILDDPSLNYNTGFHLYLNGQKSKITAAYENRPLFRQVGDKNLSVGRRGAFILQYQVQF